MTGTDLVNYDKAWAEQAEQYAAQHAQKGGSWLITRGGTLMYGDEVLPGNQAAIVILDSIFENTFYAGSYNPDQAAAPVCYAFGRMPSEMAPHTTMQADLNYFKP
jgi:hypothetical protein